MYYNGLKYTRIEPCIFSLEENGDKHYLISKVINYKLFRKSNIRSLSKARQRINDLIIENTPNVENENFINIKTAHKVWLKVFPHRLSYAAFRNRVHYYWKPYFVNVLGKRGVYIKMEDIPNLIYDPYYVTSPTATQHL